MHVLVAFEQLSTGSPMLIWNASHAILLARSGPDGVLGSGTAPKIPVPRGCICMPGLAKSCTSQIRLTAWIESLLGPLLFRKCDVAIPICSDE